MRRQFSLGGPEEPPPRDATTRELSLDRPPTRTAGGARLWPVVVAVVALAAAAWWLSR
ncbi:MAG: hypothetical protein R3F43_30305 [bacterium]